MWARRQRTDLLKDFLSRKQLSTKVHGWKVYAFVYIAEERRNLLKKSGIFQGCIHISKQADLPKLRGARKFRDFLFGCIVPFFVNVIYSCYTDIVYRMFHLFRGTTEVFSLRSQRDRKTSNRNCETWHIVLVRNEPGQRQLVIRSTRHSTLNVERWLSEVVTT